GVESVHDLLIAQSRLARGDASTTIAANMHLNVVSGMARGYRRCIANGQFSVAEKFADALRAVASGEMVLASTATEPGRELTEPATTAVRDGDEWVINGIKIFGTMSLAATHLAVTVGYTGEDGQERITYVTIPANTPGVQVNDDWDALGMRGSGSGSIVFNDVRVDCRAVSGGFPYGYWSPGLLERDLMPGLMHATPSLGIAEFAAAQAVAMASTAKKGRDKRPVAERPVIQMLAADNAIDISAMRAVFDRAASLADHYFCTNVAACDPESIAPTFKEMQTAKAFLNAASVRVVDRALTLSGGAGYMAKHPLSRAYRDVRAGGFMHPMAANTAQEFIGRIELGLEPLAA
ncbi:MAG TPA: acyl-CoA dehydrogenase, partial [Tepidiformaceae bacterium]|nr:acyl-CoA dehydrogenase [Tepidiformaceae bacterium]